MNPNLTNQILIVLISYSLWIIMVVFLIKYIQKQTKRHNPDKVRWVTLVIMVSFFVVYCFTFNNLIPEDYFSNVFSEIIGMILTVIIIDQLNNFLLKKSVEQFRKIAYNSMRTPIFNYINYWIILTEQKLSTEKIKSFNSLKDLFESQEFLLSIKELDFSGTLKNNKVGITEYCFHEMDWIKQKFQATLSKFAFRLSLPDIELLEYFSGGSGIFYYFKQIRKAYIHNNGLEDFFPFKSVPDQLWESHFNKLLYIIKTYNDLQLKSSNPMLIELNTMFEPEKFLTKEFELPIDLED